MRSDRARLNAALIDTTARLRGTETRIGVIEQRLVTLRQTERGDHASRFENRRGMMVEVLAALQRMGRSPPPAVLVRPKDMLEAIRAAMLLGAVLPELRSETEALASISAEMVRLRDAAAAERDSLSRRSGAWSRTASASRPWSMRASARSPPPRRAPGGGREAQELACQARDLSRI